MFSKRRVVAVSLMVLILSLLTACSLLNSPPVASFTFTLSQRDPPCVLDFDASSSHDSDGIIVKYEWSFGDGSSGSGGSTCHTYTKSGTYTIDLTVTDDNGKTATKSETITILSTITPTASFTAFPISGRAPLTVDFDASSSSDQDGHIISYDWDFGDGNTGVGVATSHIYYSMGTYTARLAVTDNDGATSTASQSISATTAPTGPFRFEGHDSPQSPPSFHGGGGMTFFMEYVWAGPYDRGYLFSVQLLDSWHQHVAQLADEHGDFEGRKDYNGSATGLFFLDIAALGGWAITIFTNSQAGFPPQTFRGIGRELSQYSPLFRLERGSATFYYSGRGATSIVLLDYHRNWEVLLVDENRSFDGRKTIEIDGYGSGTYLLKIRTRGDWEVTVEQ